MGSAMGINLRIAIGISLGIIRDISMLLKQM